MKNKFYSCFTCSKSISKLTQNNYENLKCHNDYRHLLSIRVCSMWNAVFNTEVSSYFEVNKLSTSFNICVFSRGVSSRVRAGYFTLVNKYLLYKEDEFSVCHSAAQTWTHSAVPAFLTNNVGRGSCTDGSKLRHTYPYFSASWRASSSVTALWSVKSHLLPHRTTSGLSQYAWICNWPVRYTQTNHTVSSPV